MKEDRRNPGTEYDPPNNATDPELDAGLRAAFSRQLCPDTMVLGDFQVGWLDDKESAQIKEHLTRCDDCQAELTRLETLLAMEETVMKPTEATSSNRWKMGVDFEWQLREAGQMVIRLIRDVLVPPQPQFATIASKGQAASDDPTILRHIVLTPAEVDDLDLEIIVRRSDTKADTCTVQVRAEVPSRWPDLAGVTVMAQAAEWQATAVTDDDGWVKFAGLPQSLLDQLVIETELAAG